jgi:hypothetical protein
VLEFGPMPNRLFPAPLPCYEGQPGELKADPYIFVVASRRAMFRGRLCRNVEEASRRRRRGGGVEEEASRRRRRGGGVEEATSLPTTSLPTTSLPTTSLPTTSLPTLLTTSVRMIPGGPGCGLQIRRRCEVAEAQLLLSDERSERSAAAHIELKLHDDTPWLFLSFFLEVVSRGNSPGCGLQIRRRCEVAEAQLLNSSTPELLLSDERSEHSAAAHIELKLHDDTL